MKGRKTGLEIKKLIITLLKERPTSLRKLETKLNIGYSAIQLHCRELEFLGIIKVYKTSKNTRNGRPYSIAELTDYGKSLKYN